MSAELVPTTQASEPLWDALRGIDAIDQHRAELAEAGDLEELAVWLVQARALRRHLADLERNIEADVARLMPGRRWEHPTIGALERRKATDRRAWRWDEVLSDAWPILAERNEGDMAAMVTDLLNLVGLTPSKGPRLEEFRALGLDPDEYAESKPGKTSVQIARDVK